MKLKKPGRDEQVAALLRKIEKNPVREKPQLRLVKNERETTTTGQKRTDGNKG